MFHFGKSEQGGGVLCTVLILCGQLSPTALFVK